MDTLVLTGYEKYILGTYLILHGSIYIAFLFYWKDSDTQVMTGWSRKSWLLDRFLSPTQVKIVGIVMWLLVIISFVISGNLVLIESLSINPVPVILIASILGIVTYMIFFNGISPTPFHWILGLFINLELIIFMLFLLNNITDLLIALAIITAWGMLFHTKVVSQFVEVKPVI